MVYKSLEALGFLLFPGHCVLCAQPSGTRYDLCPGCRSELPWQGYSCAICALPLTLPTNQTLASGHICGECLRAPPPFTRVLAPFSYDFPVDRLINRFKHQNHPASGRVLGHLLGNWLAIHATELPDALVPVPLHWRRRWRRGFNQAELLARDLGQHLSLPVAPEVLARTRATQAQQGLDARARRRNLRGAFQVQKPIRGRRLAVVDDVVTTTATSRAVTDTLLAAGAQAVEIWCLARTA